MQGLHFDLHEWYIWVVVAAGLATVALTLLAEIIDRAKIVYVKIRNFKKDDIPPMGKPPS